MEKNLSRTIIAWLVHLLTASTATIGLYTLKAIYDHQFLLALWLMMASIFIDAIDGTLARKYQVMKFAPRIDGTLLDNIVDYLNYVITPAFFLLISDILPPPWRIVIASIITLSSAYQFTQVDAKTFDHFFKGFPSYWNIAVIYLFIFNIPSNFSLFILLSLAVLIFVPIKYLYPSRLTYLSHTVYLRRLMLYASMGYCLATAGLLCYYPNHNTFLTIYIIVYMIIYLALSLFRTAVPLIKQR